MNYNSGPVLPTPPRYVMLDPANGNLRPPPYRRKIPRYESHPKKGFSCLRFLCCCCCFFFILLLILGISLAAFYFAIRPLPPKFEVKDFSVNAFKALEDFSVYTEFAVTVRTENPNDRVEFVYGEDGSVGVLYKEESLCSGSLPAFVQGHREERTFVVVLKGKSEFGSGMQGALTESRKSGMIPLMVAVKMPVRVKALGFVTREVKVFVNCSLVVNSISPNQKTKILSSKYESFSIGL